MMVTDLSQWDDTLFTLHNKSALLHLYHLWFTGDMQTRIHMKEEAQKAARWCGLLPDELGDDIIPEIDFVQQVSPDFTLTVNSELIVTVRNRGKIQPEETDLPAEISGTRDQLQELLDAAKTVQSILFERAMIDERRWSTEAFQNHFLYHPIKCHIAQQLIWGIYEGDQLLTTFHIMNDLSLSDADDHSLTLPPNAQVGIPHPLYLTEHERAQWLHLLHDYKIIQPFPQITRKIYTFTSEQIKNNQLPMVENPYLSKDYFFHPKPPVLSQEQLGWHFSQREGDKDRFTYKRTFISHNIRCEIDFFTTFEGVFSNKTRFRIVPQEQALPLFRIPPLIVSELVYFLNCSRQQDENAALDD